MALDKFQPYLFVSAGEQSNKYLTPVISPEGIASFQAQRAQDLTGLTVQIDPIQEGSGDPSPTNIRPISGRTGMTVTAKGKNLLDAEQTYIGTISNYYFCEFVSNIPLGNNKRIGAFELTVGTTYTVSFDVVSSVQPFNISIGCGRGTYAADLGLAYNFNNGRCSITFTPTAEKINKYGGLLAFRIPRYQTAQTANFTVSNIQLELGSAATAYEPYAGQTYPITWESIAGTVYGGTLDVVSGVLTVTDAQIASYAGETLPGEWISDRDVYVAGTTPTTGAQVVYKLATPQTYRLTGAEVRTIAGFNQIYSDAGPVIDIKF